MPAKVLITGATGFVGHHLTQQLLAHSAYQLRAAIRGAGNAPPPGVEVIAGFDMAARARIDDAVQGVDTIVHLAARVHVTAKIDDWQRRRYDQVNIDGTVALAEAACLAGVRRLIFLSTIAVNGMTTDDGRAFTAEDPRMPRTSYGYSKSAAEKALEAVSRRSDMEIVIIRPPLVYGPGVKGNMLRLMRTVARRIPLPFGLLTDNRRTLVGIQNLVDLIEVCIDHPAAANQIFLAGDEEDLSTAELVTRLAAALGVRPRLFPLPPTMVEFALELLGARDATHRLTRSLRVDTAKTRQVLDWRPRTSVDEGLRSTAEWYRTTGQ